MKVLVISPVFPYPLDSGLKKRVAAVLQAIAQNHEVSLLCFSRSEEELSKSDVVSSSCRQVMGIPIQSCRRYGAAVFSSRLHNIFNTLTTSEPALLSQWHSPAMEAALSRSLSQGYDVVWIVRCWLNAMVRSAGVRTVLDLDDLESVAHRRKLKTLRIGLTRMLGYVEAFKLARLERKIVREHSVVVVASERDRRLLQSPNVFVVPNTVSLHEFTSTSADDERPDDLIFFGNMNYRPNEDAVEYFCASIWPRIKAERPKARLWVVGANPGKRVLQHHDGESVLVTGYVEDLRSFLATCGVVVVPIRIGGGTRIKILDALSLSKAVVSTTIGCEGLEVAHGVHLLIADRPKDFAWSCLDLMTDGVKRASLGQNGRRLVERKYASRDLSDAVNRVLDVVQPRTVGVPVGT